MPRLSKLLSIVLILALACVAMPQSRKRGTSLKGRLGSIQKRKRQTQIELRQTRAQAKVVQKDLHVVKVRLNDVEERLADTRQELGGARREQAAVASDLANTTAELERTREQARRRLRAMAKQGGSNNVLAALVTSRSVGELAERKDLMERIAQKDHALFDRVKRLQKGVAARKRRQDALVVRVGSLVRRQRAQEAELQVQRTQKGQALVGLNQQAQQLQATLRQMEQDEQEVNRLIALAARRVRRPGQANVPAFIGRFLKPVSAPITSGFGMRYHPILHYSRLHAGVDFGAPTGTPVHCAGPGEVVAATRMSGFGNVVIVDHGGGVTTVYAHLSRICVGSGVRVRQGQLLGNVGQTGLATGPHLHWEVHVGGRAVNPMGRF